MEAAIKQLSDYERQRGKPMPDTVHAAIEANLSFELKLRYRQTYRVMSEVSLATHQMSLRPMLLSTPALS